MALPCSAGARTARLTGIDLFSDAGGAHVVLSLSRQTKFHYFTLKNPPRLVIDLADTRPAHDGLAPPASGPVRDVRMGRHKDGTLRVVFDLAGPAKVSVQQRPGAHGRERLVVTLAGSGEHSSRRKRPAQPVTTAAAHARTGPLVVAIDPGHGGHDPGTTGPHGLHEKTVTLAIGRMVAQRLNRTGHVHAFLTRHSDRYVSLTRRVIEAQQHHAALFVSIHMNAYPHDPQVNGGTCYALSEHGASDAEAAQLARVENSSDRDVAGIKFSKSHQVNVVLTDLLQSSSIDAADNLAHEIIGQFGKIEPVYDHKVQHANFAVLRDPLIPSVLCEAAFLSNPRQARELHHRRFRAELADAIYRGIMHYLHSFAPRRFQAPAGERYVVQRGDTLSGIAHDHGVTTRALKTYNGLDDSAIQVGQVLHLPPAATAQASEPDRTTGS
ncbi:MAG TPA: N-acetylmuramoyl-L-alanine amidase [Gammaproteobacteria bacterium]|nr:N-acetylmuramoyl-L-alanine amidase [Gammaproteobacteria bacterium]